MKTTLCKAAGLFLILYGCFSSVLHAQVASNATAQDTCTGKCPSIRGGAIDSKTFISVVSKRRSKIALVPYHNKSGSYGIVAWTYRRSKAGPREMEADLPLIGNCGTCVDIPAGDTLGFWMLTKAQVKALCDTLKKRKDYIGIAFVPVNKSIPGKAATEAKTVIGWAVIPLKGELKDDCKNLLNAEYLSLNLLIGDANPCPPCNTKTGRIQ